jgi:hypothetical protein
MLGDREQVQSIEAGDTIALLKRVLPKSAMPEVLTAVRQKNDRDRKIAALFRGGKAERALAMKRADGTARLLEGDTDQVVRQIADLFIERNDALKSQHPSYGVTITTLTNAEAADIEVLTGKRDSVEWKSVALSYPSAEGRLAKAGRAAARTSRRRSRLSRVNGR